MKNWMFNIVEDNTGDFAEVSFAVSSDGKVHMKINGRDQLVSITKKHPELVPQFMALVGELCEVVAR